MVAERDPYILCEDLFKIYKIADLEVVALRGLDLEVDKGEVVAIVGASGSGKTTLLNLLDGELTPGRGEVTRNPNLHVAHFGQNNIDRLRPEYRTVLLLWGVEGLKYREIAEIQQIPIGTVMSRLHRARSILTAQLAEFAEETGALDG